MIRIIIFNFSGSIIFCCVIICVVYFRGGVIVNQNIKE